MSKIKLNDKWIPLVEGMSLLDVARKNGAEIPTICHHEDLSNTASCRICLVEVDTGQLVCACSTTADDGMIVRTDSPTVIHHRRLLLDQLMSRCPELAFDDTEFARLAHDLKVSRVSRTSKRPNFPIDQDPNPFIRVDLNHCILCTRCVRACNEVQGRYVLGVANRGRDTKIIAGADTTMQEARCESCGACAAYCPTGALTDRQFFGIKQPLRKVTTTCGYCGVGCQFDLNIDKSRIVGVTSNPNAPVNGMSLCVKGRYSWDFVHHSDRLRIPLVRKELLDKRFREKGEDRGEWVEVDWNKALEIVAQKIVDIKASNGPDAIGVLSSAKCTNEENYLAQKLARQVIGTNNIDHCARLCHSSTVAGLKMAFGSGAMSNSMKDIVEHAKAIFVVGSNTTEQHPVFGAMIRQSVLKRDVKLIVADPRRIDLTEFATLHLRQRPGTDIALLNGIIHLIIDQGLHDQAFIEQRCEGFDEFRKTVNQYQPADVARTTGVPIAELQLAAELLSKRSPLAAIWAMGITQHTTGVMNVLSLANLQMLTGNMGISGGGVNPLRGQNNVQGACDMGALPNVFPGYQSTSDQAATEKFSGAWKTSGGDRFESNWARPGLTVTEMIRAAGGRSIRMLYIIGEDPVMSEPDSNDVQLSLSNSEFVVLQEIFPSETSRYADVLLPGASFAEKSGTITNTERRVQLIRPAVAPPGDAKSDGSILTKISQSVLSLEARHPVGHAASWNYQTSADIMDEIAKLTPSYAGVDHRRLEKTTLQWPVPNKSHPGTPILHVDEFSRGKGLFHPVDHLPPAELPNEKFPLLLTTGRVLYHWHGGELSRRSRGLLESYPESLVEISPEDARRFHLASGGSVKVVSRRGEMVAKAFVTDRVPSGVVFGNFHFPGLANVNNLTIAALDPIAKIPEYKACAVCIEPIS